MIKLDLLCYKLKERHALLQAGHKWKVHNPGHSK